MPKTHTHTTYDFDELSTPAQDKAIEAIRVQFSRHWWDSGDRDMVGQTMLYALADEFKTPGWDTHGEGDFPGIDGLTVEEWDLDQRVYKLGGYLTPETAPGLTWPPNATQYNLASRDYGANFDYTDEDMPGYAMMQSHIKEFGELVANATGVALKAGQTAYDYRTGDEYIREYAQASNHEFNEDGSLHQ